MRQADYSDPFAGIKALPRLPKLTPISNARMGGAAGLVKFMARTMIEQRSLKGDCTETDLRMAGFTRAEIDTHGMEARQVAMRAVREAA
ncbi:hypothetical protein SAMN02745157_0667 [Kaistia soli DSM 19436]|uniref:Uncharacterized protein n=1 Tax=Kaistia soli DSM 19436 TaxID=1122133 RepID=A0A1M4VCB4_9HYPH|nr:hypothetical protein [Kaistia soli]SHE66592.1 hypothetical protein SAMN02745157_0667 [Kaistia soli DSM 19436]